MHEHQITTWQAFKDLLIKRYKDPREVDKARMRLMTMKQIGSVDGYTTAFDRASLELAEVAGYAPHDEELIFMYREGLKSQIKTFLAARGTINDLRGLQEVAMEIDAALNSNRSNNNMTSSSSFRPSLHKNNHSNNNNNNYNNDHRFYQSSYYNDNSRYPSSNQFNHYRPTSSFNRFPSSSSYQQNSNRSYVPMDTSNNITQQRRPPSPRADSHNNDHRPITGNCYNCGKAGHFIRDCPTNKPQQDKQRTNIIMEESSSSTFADDSVLIINEINNTTTSKHSKPLITFMGLVNQQPAYILIDSGATNNYISEAFVKKHKLYTEPLDKSAEAILANGTSLSVIRMVPSIPIRIQDYNDEINANVLALDKYDIALSMACLNTYGPTCDYRDKSLLFKHHGKTITLKPTPTDTDVHTQVPSVKPEAILNSVADDDTSLIKDDQQLIVREGTHSEGEAK